jgi:glycine cleavage system H protein
MTDSSPSSYSIPADLLYTKEHEWARIEGSAARVGITEYAAKTLNDVVYLSLPPVGQGLKQYSSFGTIESIKAVSELYSPLSGTVRSLNSELQTRPELVNQSPYGDGWIVEIDASNLEEERTRLLSSDQYAEFLATLGK